VPNVVFVAPYFLPTTNRFIAAAAAVPGTRLGLISQDLEERLPPGIRRRLAAHWRTDDALEPDSLVEAVGAIGRQLGSVDRLMGPLEELQVPMAQVREVLSIPGMRRETAHNFRDKSRMKDVLRRHGLPCARHRLVGGVEEAWAFVVEVGYPIVVKICSRDLPHKSEAGGVALGLTDAPAVAEACRRIQSRVAERAPGAALEGFLVQRQAAGALELALGVKTDPVFGPVVMVAAGGILVEALRDFRLLLPPIDRATAEEALRGLRIGPLWDGVRGSAPLDLPAAADLLVRLGEAARALSGAVSEIDLNPVLVGRRGEGATVLDALVRLTAQSR